MIIFIVKLPWPGLPMFNMAKPVINLYKESRQATGEPCDYWQTIKRPDKTKTDLEIAKLQKFMTCENYASF